MVARKRIIGTSGAGEHSEMYRVVIGDRKPVLCKIPNTPSTEQMQIIVISTQ